MSTFIQLDKRTGVTKSDLRQGRKQGRIPAVLDQTGEASQAIEVSEKDILNILKKNPRAILQGSTVEEKAIPMIIQSIQKDSVSGRLLHIDFHRVNMTVMMDSKVAIHFAGEAAGVKGGGVLQIELHEVDVRCMPGVLPKSMEVDISALAEGDQLLVSDLIFQTGIEVLTDPTAVIIKVKTVHEEMVEEAPAS
jgi:large subunit ribosomal protein L25